MMDKLKIPFSIALFTHAVLFASNGLMSGGVQRPQEFTSIDLIEQKEQPAFASEPALKKEAGKLAAAKPPAPEPPTDKIPVAIKEEAALPVKESVAGQAAPVATDRQVESETVREAASVQERAVAAAVKKEGEPFAAVSQKEETRFMSEVRGRIEKAKFYPAWARQRGFEGIVGVRFNILPSGRVEGVKVVRPCNYEVLNRAACEAVERAAPFTRPPTVDPSKSYAMEVDLGYRLK